MNEHTPVVVCALYKFVALPDYKDIQPRLKKLLVRHSVCGTLLLAHEGINGTIAGSRESIDAVLAWLRKDERFSDIDTKESLHSDTPFLRTKVKLKTEIVTLGEAGADPTVCAGTYVEPDDWNALLKDPDVTVIDTRNNYEVQIGTFQGAINPQTESFREFPDYVERKLDGQQDKKIAMFCTGGIRCEKSTALLKSRGFKDVYHLKGGILNYLEKVPEKESLWQGECFVFDDRVAVNHQLEKGQYDQCHACRRPVTEADKQLPSYTPGVSCRYCIDDKSDEQKNRYAERQKQMEIARTRGQEHIGGKVNQQILVNRVSKQRLKQSDKPSDTH